MLLSSSVPRVRGVALVADRSGSVGHLPAADTGRRDGLVGRSALVRSSGRRPVRRSSGSGRRGRSSGRTRRERRRRRRRCPRRASAGRPGGWPSSLASRPRRRTGSIASRAANDPGPVALRQQARRASRARDPWRAGPGNRSAGQVDLLEQERLAVGDPKPLDVERRRADLQPERTRRRPRRPAPGGPRRGGSRGRGRGSASRSVKLWLPPKSSSRRGWRTNVPRPRVRSMRCSRASSERARRTVIRLQP